MNGQGVWAQFREFFWSDPLLGTAVSAAIFAMATTPIVFLFLARMDWLKARRGRILQRPEFLSVVMAMLLIMGIPAIFTALVIKSRYFDKNRYEFDPNGTLTVLDQGRQFESIAKADEAVREEMKRLAEERKNLVEGVKKLDEAMLTMRAASAQSPLTAQAIPQVLERLARIRQSVGVDGPQQLMDFTAPPAAIAGMTGTQPMLLPPASMPSIATAPVGSGLTRAELDVELASVPDPQKPIAGMLPLSELPGGWIVGKSGTKHLESFNADNLFEKIDGRAESFLQYNVKGMAYAYYHPVGDESSEAQLYIFEMGDPLKALGKFGSEKPGEGATIIPLGSEGYTSAGSTFFYLGKYYTQIVTTKDDAKLASFALDLGKRVAAQQQALTGTLASGEKAPAGPEEVFKLLPGGPRKSGAMFVPRDVFGYSFLSNVFLANYEDGEVKFQGFLRPYPNAEAAREVLDKYLAGAKLDGAKVQEVEGTGADRFLISINVGLVDVLFLKGNALGGVNGVPETDRAKAEGFAKGFVKDLPKTIPYVDSETKEPAAGEPEKAGEGAGQ